ncbi:hypothetical protein [Bradyrhizobium lablabi]|uniref:hypothetical protein n=1 Tax=Bradyrhizobium lablabi TaxID=722472 RepID=UPI0009A70AF4|nr:hypothetical protein [Bradyrhizobium lablabi]
MRRILTVPLIAISGPELSGPDFLRMAMKLGATNCLRNPFRPTMLLGVFDECLSEAEPHRWSIAALTAVTGARSDPQRRMQSRNLPGDVRTG